MVTCSNLKIRFKTFWDGAIWKNRVDWVTIGTATQHNCRDLRKKEKNNRKKDFICSTRMFALIESWAASMLGCSNLDDGCAPGWSTYLSKMNMKNLQLGPQHDVQNQWFYYENHLPPNPTGMFALIESRAASMLGCSNLDDGCAPGWSTQLWNINIKELELDPQHDVQNQWFFNKRKGKSLSPKSYKDVRANWISGSCNARMFKLGSWMRTGLIYSIMKNEHEQPQTGPAARCSKSLFRLLIKK